MFNEEFKRSHSEEMIHCMHLLIVCSDHNAYHNYIQLLYINENFLKGIGEYFFTFESKYLQIKVTIKFYLNETEFKSK